MAKKINIIANLIDKQFRKQLRDIENGKYKINVDVDNEKISKTSNHINQIGNAATSTNTTFGKLKNTITDTFSTGRISMTMFLAVLNEIRKAGKNAKQTIEEIDEAITNLSIATNMTREATAGLVKDYNNYAKELKSTTTQVTSAADDYLRAGKSMSEAKDLIKDSIMLSKLGQIDSATATEDILATMNGYEMSIEEVGKALDAMVAIDMEAATSAGDLATGLKYSAASASSAELSFNKLVAILGTVQDKTQQSAEIVGTFANTMLSRYRDVTIGKYLTDDGEDISNYESVLKSVGIALRDEQGEFRNFETVLQEMADKWETLSSSQQNALIKVGAGTRQANRFIALMEGYNKVLELTEVAANSAGTAVEKFNNSYTNSLEAKQNTLKAAFESMVINSDFDEVYSGIIEATTALVDFMNQTNALKGIMAGLTVSTGIKFFLAVKSGANEAYISLNKFANALKIAKQTKISTADFDKLLVLSKGLSASQMKLVLSTNSLTVAQKKELLVASGLSKEEAILQLHTWKMTTAQTGLAAATTSLGNAFKGLWKTIKANPLMLIISGITLGVSAWQKYKQAIEEAVSSANEAANTYSEQAASIDKMVSKYQDLREQLIAAKGSEEETFSVKQQLLELQTELNEQFGDEYTKLNLVTDAYKDQTEAIKAYNKEASQKYLNENRKGIEQATKQMEKASSYYLGSMNGLVYASELKYLDEIKAIAFDNNIAFTDTGFEFVGNANEASDTINTFMNQIKDLQKEAGNTSSVLSGIFDGILDNSGEALADANSIIDKYSEIYEQAKLAEIASDDKLSSGYSSLINAVSAYKNAVLKSENPYNDENVRNAYDNLQTVKQCIEDNEEEWRKYSDIVEEVYNQADTSSYSFYDAIEKNKSGIGDLLNELKGLSTIDLQAMADDGDNGDTFDKLCDSAKEYGLELQDVIDLLLKLGYVQGEIVEDSKQEDFIPSFSYNKLSDIPQKLAEVENAYKTAQDALNSYNEKGYYSMDVVDSILSLEDEYINVLVDQNGQLQINESSMNQLAKIKIEAAKASIYQETCEELVRIKTLDTSLAAQELALVNGTLTQSAYETAKALYEEVQAMGGANAALANNVWDSATKKVKLLDNQLKSLNIGSYDVGKSAMANTAKKATEDAEKTTKEYIESYMDFQKKSLEAGKIDYNTYCNTVSNLLKSMFKDGKIAAKDYHDYTKEMLTVQKSIYDKAISGMVYILDQEIDRLGEEKELIESNYQTKIDAIQSEIDALNEANDARQEQIDLEKAQYELEKAQNQRVNKVYNGEQGFVYQTDSSAIRDAEDEVAQRTNDIKISQLESQIKSLEDAMESETKVIDDQIAKYEEYKEQIQDVADAYENAENVKYALAVTGLNSEADILQCRTDVLNTFKDNYIAIQQAIADAAWASANEQIKAAKEAAKGVNGNTDTPKVNNIVLDKKTPQNVTKKITGSGGKYASKVFSPYASGTKNAKPGWHPVSEDEYGDEIILTNDGDAVVANGEQLYPFEGGEVVIKASETEKILGNMGNLVPLQTNDIWKKFADNMPDLSSMVKFNIPDYSRLGDIITRNNTQQPNVTIGDIHLHEVQNVTDFSKALQKHLPNISVQYNGRH